MSLFLLILCMVLNYCFAQDYDVNDIQCSFASQGTQDSITAKLKKPENFKGAPIFADDRHINPDIDFNCAIKQDLSDPTELSYDLKILDFSRCGVLKRNGFVHVRIWFPLLKGVVMQSDQELIIMCKPPEPTVIQNKAAGFSGSFSHGARVSGVVEETPGRLEYEVALYKEAPPIARINIGTLTSQHINHSSQSSNTNEVPVDQAVQIGTKLQLRAKISIQSVWKYVKLMEVTVSPDPDDPYSAHSISLVKEGCRNRDFASIIPHQPARYRDRPNEVFLDFEAFLLSSMKERSTLWIHSQIKACMDAADCQPDFCLDLYESSGTILNKKSSHSTHGHGRRKRTLLNQNSTEFTKFKENIEYTVLFPGEYTGKKLLDTEQCKYYVILSIFLVLLLVLFLIITSALVFKIINNEKNPLDLIINSTTTGYTGRTNIQ